MKCLLKEFSQAVLSISTESYSSIHAGALNFGPNELITVLERPSNGANWRGFILDRTNYTTRAGYFPPTCVKLLLADDSTMSTTTLKNTSNTSSNRSSLVSPRITRTGVGFATSSTNSLLIAAATNGMNAISRAAMNHSILTNPDAVDNLSIIESAYLAASQLNSSTEFKVCYISIFQFR